MAILTSDLKSSAISRITYDTESGRLEVTFTKGGTANVQATEAEFEALKNAPSAGSYFNQVLKGR